MNEQFNYKLTRMKQAVESPSIRVPKGLSGIQLTTWIKGVAQRAKYTENRFCCARMSGNFYIRFRQKVDNHFLTRHKPSDINSGQLGKCHHCNLRPINKGTEVYDGCLGELPPDIVMNTCCGHGDNDLAYIQYWDRTIVRGNEAKLIQKQMIEKDK